MENSKPDISSGGVPYEREYILRKLAETEGNLSRTAELMGIDRSHLYRRRKALGINPECAKDNLKVYLYVDDSDYI
jgi:DNA-binding NtrC family response regulator